MAQLVALAPRPRPCSRLLSVRPPCCCAFCAARSALGSAGDAEALQLQKGVMRLLVALDQSDSFTSHLELAKVGLGLQNPPALLA